MPRSVPRLVEEQMARWRIERMRQATSQQQRQQPYARPSALTVSEEYGAGGRAVAASLGQQLAMPVYDREIVAHIAQTAHVRAETVELLDQRALNFIDDYLTSLLHERSFDRSDYLHALTRTVTALWGHGGGVFVGHGAVHILPRQSCLAVRITAPRSFRCRRVQESEGIDAKAALQQVERKDAEREAFLRRLFASDIHDPLGYDLVINAEHLDTQAMTTIVVTSFRSRFRT